MRDFAPKRFQPKLVPDGSPAVRNPVTTALRLGGRTEPGYVSPRPTHGLRSDWCPAAPIKVGHQVGQAAVLTLGNPLGVTASDMTLGGIEELLVGSAGEAGSALAVRDPLALPRAPHGWASGAGRAHQCQRR